MAARISALALVVANHVAAAFHVGRLGLCLTEDVDQDTNAG